MYGCLCVCVCVEASKESSTDTKSNAGDFSTVCTCRSVCVSPAKCCASVLVIKGQRWRHQNGGDLRIPTATRRRTKWCAQKKRNRERISCLFPTGHNPGNPGSGRYPIPTPASSSNSHEILQIPSNGMSPPSPTPPRIPSHTRHIPSRLLTQTGTPQRLQVVFAPQIQPKDGSACVEYISISRGMLHRGPPSFHSFPKLPPPLTGMKAATSSHLLGCVKQGVPTPHRHLFIFNCSNCPRVKAVEENVLPEFPSENEKQWSAEYTLWKADRGRGRRTAEGRWWLHTRLVFWSHISLHVPQTGLLAVSPLRSSTETTKASCREGTYDRESTPEMEGWLDGEMRDRGQGGRKGSRELRGSFSLITILRLVLNLSFSSFLFFSVQCQTLMVLSSDRKHENLHEYTAFQTISVKQKLTISYWNKRKLWNDITGNQFLTWKIRVQELTLLAWVHSLHATKTHFRPPPHHQTQSHIHVCLPSILCCFPGVLWTDPLSVRNPNNSRAKKKKKADVWLPDWASALKSCPTDTSQKLGLLHLNWQTQCSRIQKKRYCNIIILSLLSHAQTVVSTHHVLMTFSWSLYLLNTVLLTCFHPLVTQFTSAVSAEPLNGTRLSTTWSTQTCQQISRKVPPCVSPCVWVCFVWKKEKCCVVTVCSPKAPVSLTNVQLNMDLKAPSSIISSGTNTPFRFVIYSPTTPPVFDLQPLFMVIVILEPHLHGLRSNP